MAGYRQFHTKFWKDEWVISLEIEERYLYSYLFTNELSSISGIYQIPLKVIRNETDLSMDFIQKTLRKFQDEKKIYYKDGIMWVVNMKKHHNNASPRTMVKVNNDIADIPDGDVKTAYLYHAKTGIYSIDTVSIPNTESVSVIKNKSAIESGNESVSDEEHAPDISPIQRMLEKVTGLMPANANDVKAMDEIESMHPIQADVQAGADWLKGQGKVIRYYSSLVGPIRTAVAARVQSRQTVPRNSTASIQERNKQAIENVLREAKNGNT